MEVANLLAAADVDAMRLHLRQLSARDNASADIASIEEDEQNPVVEALAGKAVTIADDILRRGLPHLERAAEAAERATTNDAAVQALPTIELAELGLTLRSQSVMGQVVWPAAMALSRWLLSRTQLAHRARVIELGAGCAAPGLVARSAGASMLLATDGDDSLLDLMAANCEANKGGPWAAAVLDWRDSASIGKRALEGGGWDLVLAADVLYSAGDILPLISAASQLLSSQRSLRSRFLLACSTWFDDLQPSLLASAEAAGFALRSKTTPSAPVLNGVNGTAHSTASGHSVGQTAHATPQHPDHGLDDIENHAVVLEFVLASVLLEIS